jgi:hypothetical protein
MTEYAEQPAFVLREHSRIGRVVWISFTPGGDHKK